MHRLKRMDGLRGVLAVYVLLGHVLPFIAAPGWAQNVFRHGEAAVDLFFALSGLVIFNSLERFGGAFFPFMAARARRLLPVYFIVLAFSVALLALGNPLPAMPWVGQAGHDIMEATLPAHFLSDLAAHLLLIHGLIPQAILPFAYVTLLGPAWSLSTEWQFYVLAGLVAPKRLGLFALALLAAGAAYHLAWPAAWVMSRAFLPDAAPFFALGVASALWLRGGNRLVFMLCLLGACALGAMEGSGKILVPLAWALMMLAQWHRRGAILESRALQYLGAISYPLYLVNEPVLRGIAMLHAPPALVLPLVLAGSLGLAALLHHYVEIRTKPRMKESYVSQIPVIPGATPLM